MHQWLPGRRAALLLMTALSLLLAACGGGTAMQPTAAPPVTEPTAAPAPRPTEVPAVAQPTTAPATDAQPLKVVATFSILGDFVQQVAGNRVVLTTLVGPGSDAHTYEPTPRDSAALAQADILFENGLEFEGWIDQLYTASGSKAQRVVVSERITPLPAAEIAHEDDHALEHACEHFADPPVAVTAGSGAAIPDDHTHYQIALSGGAGDVALTQADEGEVTLYLSADVPFAVLAGATPLTPEKTKKVGGACAAIAIAYTYDLTPGDYTARFGPGAGEQVALVWELAGEHMHGDEKKDAHGHSHGEYDPHVWQDPNNAMLMVEAIRDALVAADPNNAATYEVNAAGYLTELKELDASIQQDVKRLPEERRRLVTNHDTLGYFAYRYGFTVVGTALGTTTERADPAAGEIARLVEDIRAADVPAIFVENVSNPALMENIAREAGVKLAPSLYTDALGKPGSEGETYLKMMRYNVRTIVEALAV
ncbi:MAG: metal ABC transporter solute-binding protein, Zn/Mn family [Chloroflexaceae bacterium]